MGIDRDEAELLAEIIARDAADRTRADLAPEAGRRTPTCSIPPIWV